MNTTELTALERQAYRRQLRKMTARLTGNVAELEDEAERDAEEAVARTVLISEEQLLAEANAALQRLSDGTFGKCEHCGHAISRKRLDAVPYARECIRCAREVAPGARAEAE